MYCRAFPVNIQSQYWSSSMWEVMYWHCPNMLSVNRPVGRPQTMQVLGTKIEKLAWLKIMQCFDFAMIGIIFSSFLFFPLFSVFFFPPLCGIMIVLNENRKDLAQSRVNTKKLLCIGVKIDILLRSNTQATIYIFAKMDIGVPWCHECQ